MGFFGSSVYSYRAKAPAPLTPHFSLYDADNLDIYGSPSSSIDSPLIIQETSLTCRLSITPILSPAMTAELVQPETDATTLARSKSTKSVTMLQNFERRRLRYAQSIINLDALAAEASDVSTIPEMINATPDRSTHGLGIVISDVQDALNHTAIAELKSRLEDTSQSDRITPHALLCIRADTQAYAYETPTPSLESITSIQAPRKSLIKRSIMQLRGMMHRNNPSLDLKPASSLFRGVSLKRALTKRAAIQNSLADSEIRESSFTQFCEGFLKDEGGFDALLEVLKV